LHKKLQFLSQIFGRKYFFLSCDAVTDNSKDSLLLIVLDPYLLGIGPGSAVNIHADAVVVAGTAEHGRVLQVELGDDVETGPLGEGKELGL
jgi:hypothetical protein